VTWIWPLILSWILPTRTDRIIATGLVIAAAAFGLVELVNLGSIHNMSWEQKAQSLFAR
jgi:hypothetical protein